LTDFQIYYTICVYSIIWRSIYAKLEAAEYKTFEKIKQTDKNGLEFWLARDLQGVLNYSKWENFSKVIDRAMLACKNSGLNVANHFPDLRKMVQIGSGAAKSVIDYKLTRYLQQNFLYYCLQQKNEI